ncbi:MAG: VOC family protein [Pseudomonadota bacterium]
MLTFDHLVFTADALDDGALALENALGVPLAPGGTHPAMGTHNRLLSLGPDDYLEVIAIDPDAPPPDRPRWYNMDAFSGPPRLTNWACRTEDLEAALGALPPETGVPMALARGELRWRMAVPHDGVLAFGGWGPALLQWQGKEHPAVLLPDRGVRLARLTLTHPEARVLSDLIAPLLDDPRIVFETAPAPGLTVELATPKGLVTL